MEKLVEKYGDAILELFHKHNYQLSSGFDSFLIALIQQISRDSNVSSNTVEMIQDIVKDINYLIDLEENLRTEGENNENN
jgi:hypothetical protein